MNSLKLFLILVFAECVIPIPDITFKRCSKQDIICLNRATEQFLGKTSRGIPDYDIWPIDPLRIPRLDVLASEDMGLMLRLRNLNVTGMKDQKLSDFQINTVTKSVQMNVKTHLKIVTDVVIELQKESKSISGMFTLEGDVIGAVQFGYDLENDSGGVQHFVVGPETRTCEAVGEPVVNLSPELIITLLQDPAVTAYKADYETHRINIGKHVLCKIFEPCLIDTIHNLRASAKVLPATSYFTDI